MKTLKDIGFCNNMACCIDFHEVELKEAAKEHVKRLRKEINNGWNGLDDCCIFAIIAWINKFFNLEEDDGKD